ncbi:MAG: DUF4038 domain-containing protein, partial [Bacteroidota bacterium]
LLLIGFSGIGMENHDESDPTVWNLGRLRITENSHFFQFEDGSPFFWLGDTAWELFHRLKKEEIKMYLENRHQKGFNVIQAVILAEMDGLRKPNQYGHVPFRQLDPGKPNEDYFLNPLQQELKTTGFWFWMPTAKTGRSQGQEVLLNK